MLLDGFNEILNDGISSFLRSAREQEDLDRFYTSTKEMQEKLTDLLHFVYDWDSKMKTSTNKRRIQGDAEWTILCYYCVWVTTQLYDFGLGALDTLYAECIEHKEVLTRDLQAYVLEGVLDAGR